MQIDICRGRNMNRPRVPLRKFVKEYSVRNKANEDIPVYSVTNSQGFCTEYFGKEVASHDKTTYKIVPRGYFAYNPSRINVGSVDWQRCEERVIVSPLYTVFSVSDEIDCQYLYYFLRSDFGKQMIKARASGSVRDNLKLEMLKEMTIPDISKEGQHFCAQILDCLQILIQLRKQELQKLDDLIKARFVETFGRGNYQAQPLSDVCNKITDGTHKTPQYLEEGITFISAKNIVNGELDFKDVKFISEEEYQEIQKRCQTEQGDILLSKSGSLGAPVIVKTTEKLGLFESLAVLKYNRKMIVPEFLCEQLKSDEVQRQFKTGTKGVAIKHLHLGVIASTQVIVPPMELQQQFATFVAEVDKSKLLEERQVGFIAKISQKPGR
jgi:type I restriction enzyme S subunit